MLAATRQFGHRRQRTVAHHNTHATTAITTSADRSLIRMSGNDMAISLSKTSQFSYTIIH
jgi:hypothetical protein